MKAILVALAPVIASPKSHFPVKVCKTPLTVDEIIWLVGEVTLIDKNPAMLIKNPKVPCSSKLEFSYLTAQR
jgi:hypothetical protein